jgi:hypothetical protein
MSQSKQEQAGYDALALFQMVAPERSVELADLVSRYTPAFFLASDQTRFLLSASPSFGFVQLSNRTLLRVWLLAWVMWKEMYCWFTFIWMMARSGAPFRLSRIDLIPDQKTTYAVADALYCEVMAFVNSDPMDWTSWPAAIPKPRDIAQGSKEDGLIKDLAHHAIAFFLLHEVRHIMLHTDGSTGSPAGEEELECDRWAIDYLLAQSAVYATTASEDPVLVKSKRAMGIALGMAVIAHIQHLGPTEPGREHPSVAERMARLSVTVELPVTDFFWNVASCFLLASQRRRDTLPRHLECADQRDLLMKLLAPQS